ncbi:phosphoribosylglycinamide formyltransferase [Desulfotruncus alcoholivorax]|uniref:phosphoribosylglycinamide formyltransferase n=1 Tax=Desulfotruncus alcoholivorax TaxID=265477 RepID=UPI0003F6CD2A|nr:phosphoribosylglycinamide formyltransferase [Desulfotruncus alcoholivorax]
MNKINLGVLASGRGSNLQSIMDACESGRIPARVAMVISDNSGAFALERARRAGIKAEFIDPEDYSGKADFERKIVEVLQQNDVELVCLAGYMRLVGKGLLAAFNERIINIHPALLPSFPGLHAQEQAWNYGVKFSGCTVHFVDEGMDTGPIILQAVVPVYASDTAETLAERILEQEHKIYPEAVRLFCEGKLEIKGRKVYIKE